MSGEFVARMEDVLDLYQDYDPDHPVVCFDETSKQLVADKRPAIGAKPGRVERYDYEYKRNGTRNLFMFCEESWLAACRGDRAAHCCGLRSSDEVAG